MRNDKRANNAMRPLSIESGFQPDADGSILIKTGNTHVSCAVTIEDKVPPFLKDSGQGWITAEYGMLPCATNTRTTREAIRGRSGRTYEVQRLIGRSLRTMLDLGHLGERTLRVDCDVIRADGGTRTAAITGASLAIQQAVKQLMGSDFIHLPALTPVAAVSVGIVDGEAMLDLDYNEDSRADVDANFVMNGNGEIVEIQCTAEGRPFTWEELNKMSELARQGIDQLLNLWVS